MRSLLQVLMERDGMTKEEALKLIEEAREDLFYRIEDGENPEDICQEWFGLEPDYLMDLID